MVLNISFNYRYCLILYDGGFMTKVKNPQDRVQMYKNKQIDRFSF